MQPQQVPGANRWLPDAERQGVGAHAVLHRQDAGLELLADRLVRGLGCIRRRCARLYGKGKVGVT